MSAVDLASLEERALGAYGTGVEELGHLGIPAMDRDSSGREFSGVHIVVPRHGFEDLSPTEREAYLGVLTLVLADAKDRSAIDAAGNWIEDPEYHLSDPQAVLGVAHHLRDGLVAALEPDAPKVLPHMQTGGRSSSGNAVASINFSAYDPTDTFLNGRFMWRDDPRKRYPAADVTSWQPESRGLNPKWLNGGSSYDILFTPAGKVLAAGFGGAMALAAYFEQPDVRALSIKHLGGELRVADEQPFIVPRFSLRSVHDTPREVAVVDVPALNNIMTNIAEDQGLSVQPLTVGPKRYAGGEEVPHGVLSGAMRSDASDFGFLVSIGGIAHGGDSQTDRDLGEVEFHELGDGSVVMLPSGVGHVARVFVNLSAKLTFRGEELYPSIDTTDFHFTDAAKALAQASTALEAALRQPAS